MSPESSTESLDLAAERRVAGANLTVALVALFGGVTVGLLQALELGPARVLDHLRHPALGHPRQPARGLLGVQVAADVARGPIDVLDARRDAADMVDVERLLARMASRQRA